MNRKDFIKTFGSACFAGTGLITLFQRCAGSHYAMAIPIKEKVLCIRKTEFETQGKHGAIKKSYVLAKAVELNFPVCIFLLPGDQYSAILLECSHNGCELQPRGEFLVCPCHGSEFSKLGVVQNPPAENNLKTFCITSDHENIYVHL